MEGNGKVQIAYLHSETVTHNWVESLRAAWQYDRDSGANVLEPRPLNIRSSSGMLVRQRNYATGLFLDHTPHEWLMMLDTDMGFEPDAIHRLLHAADPAAVPVIGGLCFTVMLRETDGMNGYRTELTPTMYRLGTTADGQGSFCYYGEYVADQVTRVAATGAAFLLVHRSALEAVRAVHGDHWFDMMYGADGVLIGEDFSLCMRFNALEVPVYVHTGVRTNHSKTFWASEEHYIKQIVADNAMEDAKPDLQTYVHIGQSLESLATNRHVRDGMLKTVEDLARYRAIIEATKPDLIVEIGTWTGASARWFASLGPDVISVDITHARLEGAPVPEGRMVEFLKADSTDPALVERIASFAETRRTMVILDGAHDGATVGREIELYGPLVSEGCYLVVEDTILAYAPPELLSAHGMAGLDGSPLMAVVEHLVGNPAWSRDVAVERAHPISHHPGGFWVRTEDRIAERLGNAGYREESGGIHAAESTDPIEYRHE